MADMANELTSEPPPPPHSSSSFCHSPPSPAPAALPFTTRCFSPNRNTQSDPEDEEENYGANGLVVDYDSGDVEESSKDDFSSVPVQETSPETKYQTDWQSEGENAFNHGLSQHQMEPDPEQPNKLFEVLPTPVREETREERLHPGTIEDEEETDNNSQVNEQMEEDDL
ncbi:RAD23 homolog A, nucleotide excision repair protein a isoform X2 [Trichomycterus rosablanca]|uniref:RAD23 homolog A, nucleotide excision repair protein a isoform X2 n=1 Tax=Trichomycterus rosablanca TaxID=2290929 RepID=UPI002F357C6B